MQYFYLVCIKLEESTFPRKIFLQESQAISWGRKLATKLQNKGCYEITLAKQPITRTGDLKTYRTLYPYKELKGSDWDIDKVR